MQENLRETRKLKNEKFINMSSKEFEFYLLKKYPVIFKNLNKSIYESCLGFGLEICSGWYWVIDELSEEISDSIAYLDFNFHFTQIKVKFGTSRFYFDIERKNNFFSFLDGFSTKYLKRKNKKYEIANIYYSSIVSRYEELANNVDIMTGEFIHEDKERI